jgi:metallo-beta-lactamase family protein
MQITFLGAARSTTGSMHLVQADGSRVLLDCGMFQGRRKEAFERNRRLPFDAAGIDRVLLSHAHIDHSGNLPTLVKNGFRGEIFATPATCELCDVMLRDSAHLQVRDVAYVNERRARQGKTPFEPLYLPEDVDRTMERFRPLPYGEAVQIATGVTASFHDAGHVLGASQVAIDDARNGRTRRLLFSGDIGQKDMPMMHDPRVVPGVNALITESTYGDRFHPPKADILGRLKGFVDDIRRQHGKLIIPAFSVGRTQQLLCYLNEIYETGRIQGVPVFVDSPLSAKATDVYRRHPDCLDDATAADMVNGSNPFQFRGLTYVTETEDSKRLNHLPGPAIIISASGMCEGGRILHHLKNGVGNPRNILLFVGYQSQNTLGRKIVDGMSPVRIFGEEYDVAARVHTINALSAHADRAGLLEYFDAVSADLERVFVVHGEDACCEALAAAIRERGARQVVVPGQGDTHAAF